ncbi:MAG TPA: tRNA (adenosine(37)-N6)-threonylcarbamoyltransferase complex dimerization subunit type 1 TsaB [Massilibacterium sp.]|nr:tRNA (adenosine(37)-N6)-threonylcarbamoyltransferase complex dimerization subunit type 1 TsaB [Massilibacterium sp.]
MTVALAIDTSNDAMGVALLQDQHVLGEYVTNTKKNHSVRLMPAIDQLMKDVKVTPKQLGKIIVAKGPGSYTGVRIAVTTAKTMAYTLNIPLVGVSSLEVLAQNGKHFSGYVVPFFDARRHQVYSGVYQNGRQVIEDQLTEMTDWLNILRNLEGPFLLISPHVEVYKEEIKEALLERVTFGDIVDGFIRPLELAKIGREKESVDIHTFTPTYLKLAEAEEKWLEGQKLKR